MNATEWLYCVYIVQCTYKNELCAFYLYTASSFHLNIGNVCLYRIQWTEYLINDFSFLYYKCESIYICPPNILLTSNYFRILILIIVLMICERTIFESISFFILVVQYMCISTLHHYTVFPCVDFNMKNGENKEE